MRFDQDYIRRRTAVDDNGCWIWMGSVGSKGYGSVKYESCGEYSAHRLSYKVFHGPIPDGKVVRHRCDQTLCCNPGHLILGTQSENVLDAFERGRHKTPDTSIPQSLVEDIRRLHSEGVHWKTIAETLNTSRSTIYKYSTQPKANQ